MSKPSEEKELGLIKGKIIAFENLPNQNTLDEIDDSYHFKITYDHYSQDTTNY